MNTILFFDDWLIQSRTNTERIFHKLEPWPKTGLIRDVSLKSSFSMTSVHQDKENGRWRLWASGCKDSDLASDISLYHYESSDGLAFTPIQTSGEGLSRQVFSGEKFCAPGNVFIDNLEEDPSRRFKILYSDPSSIDNQPAESRLAVSPDGINWKWDPSFIWCGPHVDTYHSLLYNPCTKKYQWSTRKIAGDRRICIYQTQDWKICEDPLVVLYPDNNDPCGMEFYGMPHFYYEGYFIGLLWKMHTTHNDLSKDHRMHGRVDSELVYSINGINWNRTNRADITSNVRASDGGRPGMVYPCGVAMTDEWIRFYCTVYDFEHGDVSKLPRNEPACGTQVMRMRKDGFCSLSSYSDKAEIVLRPLISLGGSLSINARTRSFGSIRAELLSLPENKPIEGYEMGNSLPFEGDHLDVPLRWKNKNNLDELKEKPFRLRLEVDRAEIFAIRHDCYQTVGGYWHKDLSGNCFPEFRGKDYWV